MDKNVLLKQAQPAPHEILDALNALMEYAGIIEERGDSIATDKARSVIAKLKAPVHAQQAQPALQFPEKPSDELSLQLLRSMEIAKAINRGGVPPIDFDAQPSLMQRIQAVPPFNMNGYDEDDVRQMHDWAVSVVHLAEQAQPADAKPLTNHERIELYELRHAVSAQQEQPSADLMRAIKSVPTFNMNGYDEDDVRRLHDWAVSVVYLADPPAPPPFVAQGERDISEELREHLIQCADDPDLLERAKTVPDYGGSFIAQVNNAQQEQPAAEAVREAAAQVAEGGNFLHADSPAAKFGRECAAAIRRMPLPVSDAQQAQPALPAFMIRRIEEALNPSGMHLNDSKVRIDGSTLQRLYEIAKVATNAQPVGELPRLPDPTAEAWGNSQDPRFDAYTADQMREYALKAIHARLMQPGHCRP